MRITFNCGKAGKGYNGVNPTWFGYSWGFWFPHFHHNKGNAFKNEVFSSTVHWLCFWIGMTIWGNVKKTNNVPGTDVAGHK